MGVNSATSQESGLFSHLFTLFTVFSRGRGMNTTLVDHARRAGRERLPDRRQADTFEVRYGDNVYQVAIGYYPDGRPGEVFLSGAKTGSDSDGLHADIGVPLRGRLSRASYFRHKEPNTMTRRRAKLDRGRPFGVVTGQSDHKYEQDYKIFDHTGLEILPGDGSEPTPPPAARRASSPATKPSRTDRAPSPAARRMRRARSRRRAGAMVVNIEITRRVIDQLIEHAGLERDDANDREKVAGAIGSLLDDWVKTNRQ